MSLLTLYKEELKAAVRGRFAWLGAAVVLFSIGGLAAIATQDTWLDGYGVIAYFLARYHSFLLPLAASQALVRTDLLRVCLRPLWTDATGS